MSATAACRQAVVKEGRALWPILATAVAAMIASAAVAGGRYRSVGILAYVVGAASLGALAFGHEFLFGTIDALLMQPRARRTILTLKAAVLVVALLSLAGVGRLVTFQGYSADRDLEMTIVYWLPLVTAVGVAPWLTLLFRSATAGMAFSLAMPGFMFCGGMIGWTATHGLTPFPQSFIFNVAWTGTLLFSAAGCVLGWRAFERLEDKNGGDPFAAIAWLRLDDGVMGRARGARRFHPAWLLVRKELRLQRMTFVVALGYIAMLSLLVAARPSIPDEVAEVLTACYVILFPFMPGALASAEEQQLGTVEWQMSLPMAAWKQWLVKVGVVLTVAGALAVGVPAALGTLPERLLYARAAVAVLALVAGSLYISSASRSSLWALLTAIGAMVIAGSFLAWTAPAVYSAADPLPAVGLRLVVGLAVAGTVLTLAMFNHRTARGQSRAMWHHAVAAVGCAACAIVALSLIV